MTAFSLSGLLAIEAMERPSTIQRLLSIQGSNGGNDIRISILDTGVGMDSTQLHRLFEPYATTKGSRGTGIGLFLSQQIIRNHGGSTSVRSEEGAGTEFIVRLPTHSSATTEHKSNK